MSKQHCRMLQVERFLDKVTVFRLRRQDEISFDIFAASFFQSPCIRESPLVKASTRLLQPIVHSTDKYDLSRFCLWSQ